MRHEASASLGRIVPLARICALTGVARSSVYARRSATVLSFPRRRGPKTAFSDVALTEAIRTELAASPWTGEGYRKVWAKLRHQGIRSSKARVLRLMREAGLLAPSRSGGPRGPRTHDGTIIPASPDTLWGTDLTTTVTTDDGQVAVFVAIDHATAELVGIHAAKRATRYEALERKRLTEHRLAIADRRWHGAKCARSRWIASDRWMTTDAGVAEGYELSSAA